ncbi:MAG: glycosyltransferase family 1 protein [Gemmatimonadota bacterium]
MLLEQPLRVALFTDTFVPQMNGVARTLARLRSALSARGHHVKVFTTTSPDAPESDGVVRFPSVPFWAYREMRLARPRQREALKELERFQPDVVHAATPFGVGLSGRWAASALKIPIVTSYHTSFVQYARYYGLAALAGPGTAFLRWFHNGGRRTFVPTDAIAEELRRVGFRGLRLWSRGVDTEQFHPQFRGAAVRNALGLAANGVVVSYVGRLAAEKGIDVAMRAMQTVVAQRRGVGFALAGDGPDETRCRRMAPTRTWFAGRLSDESLSAFYASSDIFVFPSTTDTFGNVLLEAMASGLAIVAADVPQSREVVGRDAGVFARAGDATEFAHAIASLVDDPNRLNRMREAALARARARGWEAVFDRLTGDYRSAIQCP